MAYNSALMSPRPLYAGNLAADERANRMRRRALLTSGLNAMAPPPINTGMRPDYGVAVARGLNLMRQAGMDKQLALTSALSEIQDRKIAQLRTEEDRAMMMKGTPLEWAKMDLDRERVTDDRKYQTQMAIAAMRGNYGLATQGMRGDVAYGLQGMRGSVQGQIANANNARAILVARMRGKPMPEQKDYFETKFNSFTGEFEDIIKNPGHQNTKEAYQAYSDQLSAWEDANRNVQAPVVQNAYPALPGGTRSALAPSAATSQVDQNLGPLQPPRAIPLRESALAPTPAQTPPMQTAPPAAPPNDRRDTIFALMDQGVTDPQEILGYVNYDQNGNLWGDYTLGEIRDYFKQRGIAETGPAQLTPPFVPTWGGSGTGTYAGDRQTGPLRVSGMASRPPMPQGIAPTGVPIPTPAPVSVLATPQPTSTLIPTPPPVQAAIPQAPALAPLRTPQPVNVWGQPRPDATLQPPMEDRETAIQRVMQAKRLSRQQAEELYERYLRSQGQ